MGSSHFPQYIIALFWSGIHILRSERFKGISPEILAIIFLTPSVVGGFPIIYLHNMLVRAESDILSSFCDICIRLTQTQHRLSEALVNILGQDFEHNPSKLGLMIDTYSLALKKPRLPASYLRDQIREVLRPMVVAQDVNALLAIADKRALQAFVKAFDGSDYWLGKLVSLIYANTVFAMVDELLAGFESSRTVSTFLLIGSGNARRGREILNECVRLDRNLNRWREGLYTKRKGSHAAGILRMNGSTCPCDIANRMRNECWGVEMESVSAPPAHHLITITCPEHWNHAERPYVTNRHFLYRVCPEVVPEFGASAHFCAGPHEPMLGSDTSMGVVKANIHIIGRNPLASKITNLLMAESWCPGLVGAPVDQPSDLARMIAKLLSAYGLEGDGTADLRLFAKHKKAGTIDHHLRAKGFRESTVPNEQPNLYTLIQGRTDSCTVITNPVEKLRVNFLEVYCCAKNLIFMRLQAHPDLRCWGGSYWAYIRECDGCMSPIIEHDMKFDSGSFCDLNLPRLEGFDLQTTTMEKMEAAIVAYRQTATVIGRGYSIEGPALSYAAQWTVLMRAGCSRRDLSQRVEALTGLRNLDSKRLLGIGQVVTSGRIKGVSLTDIRCISLNCMMDFIQGQLVTLLRDLHHANDPAFVEAMLSETQAARLPWFDLAEAIEHASIKQDVLRSVRDMYGIQPGISDLVHTESFAKFLGSAAIVHSPDSATDYIAAVESFESDEVIASSILNVLARVRYRLARRRPEMESNEYEIIRAALVGDRARILIWVRDCDLATAGISQIRWHDCLGLDRAIMEDMDNAGVYLEDDEELAALEEKIGDFVEQAVDGEEGILVVQVDPARASDIVRATDHRFRYDTAGGNVVTGLHRIPHARVWTERPNFKLIDPPVQLPHTRLFFDNPRLVHRAPKVGGYRLFRGFCGETSSAAYLAEALVYIGAMVDDNPVTVLTLAEGAGSNIQLINAFYKNARFVYNTLPQNLIGAMTPTVVTSGLIAPDRIDYTQLSAGSYDLTRISVVRRLLEHPGPAVVTCDAEGPLDDMDQIIENVTECFLESQGLNSLLYLRISLERYGSAARAATALSHGCESVALFLPTARRTTRIAYIIAFNACRGKTREALEYFRFRRDPSNEVLTAFAEARQHPLVVGQVDEATRQRARAMMRMVRTTVGSSALLPENRMPRKLHGLRCGPNVTFGEIRKTIEQRREALRRLLRTMTRLDQHESLSKAIRSVRHIVRISGCQCLLYLSADRPEVVYWSVPEMIKVEYRKQIQFLQEDTKIWGILHSKDFLGGRAPDLYPPHEHPANMFFEEFLEGWAYGVELWVSRARR